MNVSTLQDELGKQKEGLLERLQKIKNTMEALHQEREQVLAQLNYVLGGLAILERLETSEEL